MKWIHYSSVTLLLAVNAFSNEMESKHFAAPLTPKAPVIDGIISTGEWKVSLGFDGMAWKGNPEERSVTSYITADEENFYFAIVSELPPDKVPLLTRIVNNNEAVVHDDAVEVFINTSPGEERGITYQFLCNAAGAHAYLNKTRGGYPQPDEWNGGYTFKNRITDKHWVVEMKVPVANLAQNRKTTDGTWGISLCRDWKRPWVFSSAPADFSAKKCTMKFEKGAPVIHFKKSGDFFDRKIRGELYLFNPSATTAKLHVRIHTGLDMMPSVTLDKDVSVAGGQSLSIPYDASTHAANCEKIDFSVEVKKEGITCYTLNHSWKNRRKDRWTIKPEKILPFDFEYAFYPYHRQLRVKNLFQNYRQALPDSVTYTVNNKESGKTVLKFHSSAEDGHQQTVDIPDIKGLFTITLELGEDRISKEFKRKHYPWEGNSLGKGHKVYPPFTPMKRKGSTISTVLRDHDLTESGLPRQITVQGKLLLTAPASLIMNGKPLQGDKLDFIEVADDVILTQSPLKTDGFSGEADGRWEYDGTLKYDLTIDPAESKALDSLVLEIPLADEYAKMYHAMGDGIRNTLYDYLPEGEGEIWNASKVKAGYMPPGFCTYLFLGSPMRGLCFFC